LALLAGLLSVPEVQAWVRSVIFRIGSIEIVQVTATPTPTGTRTPGSTQTATPVAWNPNLVGETTLADVTRRATFPVRLPGHPAGLGEPDRIFLQDLDGPAVILAWLDSAQPSQPKLILYELSSNVMATKMIDESTLLTETTVNGLPALWLHGPHMVEIYTSGGRSVEPRRLVEGNVLNWQEGGITYRLEGALTLQEAIRIAESLEPPPPPSENTTPLVPPTATPLAISVGLAELSGEASLEAARELAGFNVVLPAYPPNLGEPDRVFVQDLGGPAVLLAWTEPGQPDRARVALQQLSGMVRGEKEVPDPLWVEAATVNGRHAVWVRGPHVLRFYRYTGLSSYQMRRMVEGNVLIWEAGGITYRLETTLSVEEAVRIAESLR
jgi:hypothetical protein